MSSNDFLYPSAVKIRACHAFDRLTIRDLGAAVGCLPRSTGKWIHASPTPALDVLFSDAALLRRGSLTRVDEPKARLGREATSGMAAMDRQEATANVPDHGLTWIAVRSFA